MIGNYKSKKKKNLGDLLLSPNSLFLSWFDCRSTQQYKSMVGLGTTLIKLIKLLTIMILLLLLVMEMNHPQLVYQKKKNI